MSQVTLTQADNGKSVQVKPGDLIVIHIDENPTTGYRWAIDQVDSQVMSLVNSEYAQSPGTGIGGGGQRTFTFKAERAGHSPIRLKLWRDFQGDNSIIQRFDLTIQVEG